MSLTEAELIMQRLCHEYQSVWIVNVKDLSLRVYTENVSGVIPNSVETVRSLSNYDDARKWYIINCVAPQDQKRLLEETSEEKLIEMLEFGEPYCVEYTRINGDKSNYNQLYFAKYEPDDQDMEHFIMGFRDIDVRKKVERDDLTGVYTRLFFFRKAEELLEGNPDEQFDLIISDVVGFKKINDKYGSEVGDEVLRWIGAYYARYLKNDIVVGRYAGDQFVMMCRHDVLQEMVSKGIIGKTTDSNVSSGLPKITIKYGVFENVNGAGSIISSCDKAHMALNTIKHLYGANIAYYDDTMRHQDEIESNIEGSMHEALKQEQFKVYYQPKHDSVTGALVGAEALIRWIHPVYGFMSPGDFIPLFERNRFVVEIDKYVWRKTCENLSKWKEKGLPIVPVSVNASKHTIKQKDLVEYFRETTEKYAVDPSYMHLEITETLMTDNMEALIEKLNAIKECGFQIELDDFGSGYSSLNVLSSLPLDVVKLDMSFMREFGNAKRSKVLNACVKLAKDLGYKTVSEGVENEMQSNLLSFIGVDAIQGYFYSRPLSEEDFEQYMISKAK